MMADQSCGHRSGYVSGSQCKPFLWFVHRINGVFFDGHRAVFLSLGNGLSVLPPPRSLTIRRGRRNRVNENHGRDVERLVFVAIRRLVVLVEAELKRGQRNRDITLNDVFGAVARRKDKGPLYVGLFLDAHR